MNKLKLELQYDRSPGFILINQAQACATLIVAQPSGCYSSTSLSYNPVVQALACLYSLQVEAWAAVNGYQSVIICEKKSVRLLWKQFLLSIE